LRAIKSRVSFHIELGERGVKCPKEAVNSPCPLGAIYPTYCSAMVVEQCTIFSPGLNSKRSIIIYHKQADDSKPQKYI